MRIIIVFLLIGLGLFWGPPETITAAPSSLNCTEIPGTFESWKLLNIHEDQYKVIRWFVHPLLSDCRGIAHSLLIDCKEHLILRSVFTIDQSGNMVESRAELQMVDGYWKKGRGVYVRNAVDVKTGSTTFFFTLEGGKPAEREVTIPIRSTYSCDQPVLSR